MRFDLVCALRILAILSLSCPMIGKANMILKKKESLHFDLMQFKYVLTPILKPKMEIFVICNWYFDETIHDPNPEGGLFVENLDDVRESP